MSMEDDIKQCEARINQLIEGGELVDDNGYPTDSALEIIRIWHWSKPKELFEFIKSIWWQPDWGWTEGLEHVEDAATDKYRYNISTGGWSGNESIIHALQSNIMIWSIYWYQSRRGGHYIFQLREINEKE